MSFVERSIILCPYLRGSTIGGSTVCLIYDYTCTALCGHFVVAVLSSCKCTCAHSAVYKLGSTMLKTESRNMEYKLGGGNYIWNILPEHLMKYGSAFLNSGGGTLCIGVNDNGMSQSEIYVYSETFV